MRWFEGSIPAAIATAKQKKAVFVIFISGEDDVSKEMTETWENESVSKLCEDANMVAMKLDAKSESCQQFSAIYPVVCIPSTFFIGNNGIPLEVTGGHLSVDDFTSKIQKVIEMHKASLEAASSDDAASSSQQPAAAATASISEDSAVPAATQASTSDDTQQEPLDVRVAVAKQKIEEKRQMKAEQAKQEEIRKEMERRKLGQQVQLSEQKKKEDEAKQLADELKRQRAEDKAAKERIRQQIAQDRADRAARFEKEKEERDQARAAKIEAKRAEQEEIQQQQYQANIKAIRETKEQVAAARAMKASKYKAEQDQKESSRTAARQAKEVAEKAAQEEAIRLRMELTRIQFKLPDGSSIMHTFPSESKLSEAWQFLYDHVGNQFGNFTLSIVYPRRQFSESDMQRTLLDLELAPSSSLIVLPGSKSVMRPKTVASGDGGIFALLFAPFLWIWGFILSIFASSPPPPQSDSAADRANEGARPRQQSPPQPSPTAPSTDQEDGSSRPVRPKSSYMRRRTAPTSQRQEGNIHRLSTQDEDDDENATWNGNSTQQM